MQLEAKDRFKFKQGDVTDGPVHVELTLHFKLRPAGWAGNDSWRIYVVENVLNVICYVMNITGMLKGDEKMTASARWRRPKQVWQKVNINS